jgi:hypothetical protein
MEGSVARDARWMPPGLVDREAAPLEADQGRDTLLLETHDPEQLLLKVRKLEAELARRDRKMSRRDRRPFRRAAPVSSRAGFQTGRDVAPRHLRSA